MVREERVYNVYVLASKREGVLYIGFTGDIEARIYQHKHEEVDGFTKWYHVKRLVYYESFDGPLSGIEREKQLKKWNRGWKIRLIEKHNPEWRDLYNGGDILPLFEE